MKQLIAWLRRPDDGQRFSVRQVLENEVYVWQVFDWLLGDSDTFNSEEAADLWIAKRKTITQTSIT